MWRLASSILNTAATIDHDCISDFRIFPKCFIGWRCILERANIGMDLYNTRNKIGKWVTILELQLSSEDVPDFAVMVGNPGKILNIIHK
jgi:acetyltransferase EpsM